MITYLDAENLFVLLDSFIRKKLKSNSVNSNSDLEWNFNLHPDWGCKESQLLISLMNWAKNLQVIYLKAKLSKHLSWIQDLVILIMKSVLLVYKIILFIPMVFL